MNARILLAGAAAALLFSASSAFAQYGTVRGKVVDEKGAPVADAEILLEGQGEIANKKVTLKSRKNGDFAQVGLPRGTYKGTVSKDGLQPIALPVSVSTGETTELGEIKLPALSGSAAKSAGNAELNNAVELAQAQNFDAAEAAFKAFLEKNPAHATAHYNLGWVQEKKKDLVSAEAQYKKAMELDPDMAQPYTALASLYQQTGRGKEGVEMMTKAAAAQPDNADFQFNLGVSLFNAGKSAEAEGAFLKAAAANPDHVEVHYYLGTTALNLAKIPEAVKHLEKYLSLSPTNTQNVATAKALIPELKKVK